MRKVEYHDSNTEYSHKFCHNHNTHVRMHTHTPTPTHTHTHTHTPELVMLDSFDHIFWFGDFNYRVELTRDVADQYLVNSDWMVSINKF